MIPVLVAASSLSALAAIACDWRERRRPAFYLFKPLTTLLILGLALVATRGEYRLAVAVALTLSLAGDVALMFTETRYGARWFLAGLGSFLLAHLAFVAAFLQDVGTVTLPAWLALVVAWGLGMLVALLPRAGAMKLPVLLYCAVLAAMVFAAAARSAAFHTPEAHRALAGALLFMLSDSLLGWRRFRGRFPHAQAAILLTYWGAIGLIACSG